MSDEGSKPPRLGSLNEVIDLLTAVNSGRLAALLGARAATTPTHADYAGVGGACGCHGAVRSRLAASTYEEFLAQRNAEVATLKARLAELELPGEVRKADRS